MASESALEPFARHVEALEGGKGGLPGRALPWLESLRAEGAARYRDLGLPTPKLESWKYTNLRALQKTDFQPVPAASAVSIDRVPSLIGARAGHRAVFVNGRFGAEMSSLSDLPEGAEVTSFAQALSEDPGFLAEHLGQIAEGHDDQALYHLNTALMSDGLVVRVRAGARIAEPLEAVFVAAGGDTPLAYHPRILIVLEPGSEATLVEHHVGFAGEPTFANSVTEFHVDEGARLHHYRLQDEQTTSFHVHTLHGRVMADGFYDGFALSVGARLARNEQHVRLEGAHADARLSGGYLVRGKQHCDNTTLIEHRVPDTSCREVFKGALEGKGRAVFQGKLHVHPDAQRTDGYQLSRALLLSDEAEIDAKPQLEIYADDVKCSHGSTAGALDAESLFYLRSRGIPFAAARRILVESFLAEVIEEMTTEELRAAFMARASQWLAQSQT